jgi:hypothetical protein
MVARVGPTKTVVPLDAQTAVPQETGRTPASGETTSAVDALVRDAPQATSATVIGRAGAQETHAAQVTDGATPCGHMRLFDLALQERKGTDQSLTVGADALAREADHRLVPSDWKNLEQIRKFAEGYADADSIILFRGQQTLTRALLSNIARKKGVAASKQRLQEKIDAFERSQSGDTRPQVLTAEESLLVQHNTASGSADSSHVSTSASVEVASGQFSGGSFTRYLYLLKAPKEVPVCLHSALSKTHMSAFARELEYSIPHDATAFVVGAVDLQTGRYYPKAELDGLTAESLRGSKGEYLERLRQALKLDSIPPRWWDE